MIAGHFGLAAAVKASAPKVPLWALMLATQWLDIVFAILLAFGIEGYAPIAGALPGTYGALIINADYTHSLIGALFLAFLFGAVFCLRYQTRCAIILGCVVLSHYALDLLVHRADMPIVPGGPGHRPRLGLGLWQYPKAAAGAELLLVALGAFTYWHAATKASATHSQHRRRAHVCGGAIFVVGAASLGLNYFGM